MTDLTWDGKEGRKARTPTLQDWRGARHPNTLPRGAQGGDGLFFSPWRGLRDASLNSALPRSTIGLYGGTVFPGSQYSGALTLPGKVNGTDTQTNTFSPRGWGGGGGCGEPGVLSGISPSPAPAAANGNGTESERLARRSASPTCAGTWPGSLPAVFLTPRDETWRCGAFV